MGQGRLQLTGLSRVLYVVERGVHNLTGQVVEGFADQFGHTTTDIDATALMYEFFLGPPAAA